MIGPSFIDEIDCGSFFDHIDDLLDFPSDEVAAASASFPPPASANCEAFPSMWNSVFSAKTASDLSAELSVPYEDIVQLEWLSNFVEDSFSGGSNDPSVQHFRTSSPVSVLETSTSFSGGGDATIPPLPTADATVPSRRGRTKRPRPPTFNSDNFAESRPLPTTPKKKKANSGEGNQIVYSQAVRKCVHCEITKTPQWRAGPTGPKTLCNACGVRYKSGRLFPEYRPVASPTFVPAIHSNSHKKVLEMRNKFGEMVDYAGDAVLETASPDVEQLQIGYV